MGLGSPYKRAEIAPIKVEDRQLGLADAAKAIAFTLSLPRVADEIKTEREDTCMTCEYVRKTEGTGQTFCSLCKCNIRNPILNLAALEEQRDEQGNVKEGCKHPERSQGKGWKR